MSSSLAGRVRKMEASAGDPVRYLMVLGDERLDLNPLLGGRLTLEFDGTIECVACGRSTRKSFGQGHCYPCFRDLASCDGCIVRPETCHYHEGTCREPVWGEAHCMQPHVVYLANSSGPKVGITRRTQVPTRWLDQGAVAALPILEVDSRRHSGFAEVALKREISDRTDWRKMLRGDPEPVDLVAMRDRLLEAHAEVMHDPLAGDAAGARVLAEEGPRAFRYPVLSYPDKVKSLNPEKTPVITGELRGIKGQYLMLDTGVINLRKYAGYGVGVSWRG